LSPFSISTALSMASAGSRGPTLEQMRSVLHLSSPEKLHSTNAALLRQVNDPKQKGHTLAAANALWGQKGFPFRKEFLDLDRRHYGADLREVDFTNDPEGARQAINLWVGKETRNRIKDLIPPEGIHSDTRLVLANAIYFKGLWASPFKPNQTREGKFFAPGKVESVPLMHQSGKFKLHEERGLQVVELPFTGNDLSMVLLVPTRKDGLAELERTLNPERLAAWLGKMRSQRIEVVVPRFAVTAEFDLKGILSELGMPLAFDRNRADFSGLTTAKEPLALSAVLHKAALDVNERGAEASAASGIMVVARGEMPQVRADRAFVFLIRDQRSNSLLFLGRLVHPRK